MIRIDSTRFKISSQGGCTRGRGRCRPQVRPSSWQHAANFWQLKSMLDHARVCLCYTFAVIWYSMPCLRILLLRILSQLRAKSASNWVTFWRSRTFSFRDVSTYRVWKSAKVWNFVPRWNVVICKLPCSYHPMPTLFVASRKLPCFESKNSSKKRWKTSLFG